MLNSKRFAGLPVRTKAGIPMGKLLSVEIDTDTGRIQNLIVRLKGITMEQAVIGWAQIVSMSEAEIVVVDAFVSSVAAVPVQPNA